ncbi:Ribonuclease H-like superfamily [Arabidopsis suecica]|uniref:Ribonuclease H-like superfamily n=1 Tax=Arabidopsis suecica TaxID=45249 RepID=A0A8T2AE19_ARASU|nr:Ribonuclease H-like superfamily [Arabidopsis suecica]
MNELVMKFANCYEYTSRTPRSGETEDDILVLAYKLYHQDQKSKFSLEHVWRILKTDQKWCNWCETKIKPVKKKAKLYEVEEESVQRPIGVKAAKALAKSKGKGKNQVSEAGYVAELKGIEEEVPTLSPVVEAEEEENEEEENEEEENEGCQGNDEDGGETSGSSRTLSDSSSDESIEDEIEDGNRVENAAEMSVLGADSSGVVTAMKYHYKKDRLKRLYQSERTGGPMRWHAEHSSDGNISHPSDAEAWKHFNSMYKDFANEHRNVYLGLCTDGFESIRKVWTQILTMAVAYDVSLRNNFVMRAVLMWTISDFPAYGMLSGWTTHGRLSCPYCQDTTDAFQLKHGKKSCWFDCHRRFLPKNHPYRRSRNVFRKNKMARAWVTSFAAAFANIPNPTFASTVNPTNANQVINDDANANSNGGNSSDEDGYDRESLYSELDHETAKEEASSELDIYLMEKRVPRLKNALGMDYDVLSWWRRNSAKFPILSKLARDVLAIQVSSAASESAFSTSGRVLDPYRSCLTPNMIEALLCLQQWMRNTMAAEKIANLAQMQAELEFHDSLGGVSRLKLECRGCLVTIGVFGSGQDDGVIHNLSRGTEEIGSGTPGRLGSGTPSDSSRGDTLIPVYKRKMVWSSSSDPEADSTDRHIELYRGSDAESASREEDPSRFTAREDAIADVARDQDLPDDPEAMLGRRGVRPPAAGEAGVSCWPNAPEAPPLSIKAEEVHYDSEEAARLLQAKVQAAKGLRKRRRAKKTRKPDPPGSTLCTEDSLRDLKAQFGFSEGVELRLPTPNERADDPPEGFFTLYEGFFYHCYLWLPIPRPILAFLWSYKIALSQITTRGLCHLIGILVRSIETVNFVDLSHLRHLLEIRRIPGHVERFYISPRPNRRVIGGFPSKDEKYTDHFFFVALNEYSIHEDYLGRVVGTWRKIGIIPEAVLATLFYSKLLIDRFLVYADRNPSFLEDIPEGFLDLHDELIARKCDWTKHFSRDRIERALRLLHGASCQSSSESSDHQLDHLIEMQGAAQSLRAKKAAERKAARERAILEANFRPPTPPEVVNDTEVAVGTEAIDEARESTALTGTEVSVDVLSTEVPEAAGTSVVVALSAEAKAKAKGKRPRGDSSGGRRKEKRSRNEAPIYKDKVASANLIASCSGLTLAAPEALLEAERYRETAAGFLKALNSMNSMVRSYDSTNRKCEISRAEADAKIAEANAKVAEADAKIAEADAKVAEADEARQGAEALAKAEKVERLKTAEDSLRLQRKFEAEIERLNRLFTEEKSLREKEVAREHKAVKKEFAKKIEAIEAKMELYGKASERYMFLVQARANAELIAELEGGKKVEEEKEEVLQWKAEYGDAEDEFVRLGTELREGLKLPPASPDSVDDSFGNQSIEGVAAGVGILDQAGTNLGSEAARVPEEQDE